MNKDYRTFRKNASIKSKGSSNPEIYNAVTTYIKNSPQSILDIGCGQGQLLQLLNKIFPKAKLTGTDLTKFTDGPYYFIEHDFNQDMNHQFEQYDLICALEVIEHLENPRHFLRQIAEKLTMDGKAIISTPNPISFLSLLTLSLKGHHNAFGPRNYPAHITPITPYQFSNMIAEIKQLELESIIYLNNGRIPTTSWKWRQLFPFCYGKRFSDNYMVIVKKKI